MITRYIFAMVSAVFLSLAVIRLTGGGPGARLQGRIWLLIALLFGAVSVWLFYQG